MTATIQKCGNSQGLRLPKKVLVGLSLTAGDLVDVAEENGKIILTPIKQNNKYNINELVAKIPHDYIQNEENFGKAKGLEEW